MLIFLWYEKRFCSLTRHTSAMKFGQVIFEKGSKIWPYFFYLIEFPGNRRKISNAKPGSFFLKGLEPKK
jgi:hypothetical protein